MFIKVRYPASAHLRLVQRSLSTQLPYIILVLELITMPQNGMMLDYWKKQDKIITQTNIVIWSSNLKDELLLSQLKNWQLKHILVLVRIQLDQQDTILRPSQLSKGLRTLTFNLARFRGNFLSQQK